MHKSFLTPNVALRCDTLISTDKSFARENVYYTVDDSAFQSSSPFRHGVILCKIIKELEPVPPYLMKYTDGGTNQRNTLESVKVASICLFKEFNLDFMIVARCALGHSCMNPGKRIMSILNLGLQNVATERAPSNDESTDKKVKNAIAWWSYENLMEKYLQLKKLG